MKSSLAQHPYVKPPVDGAQYDPRNRRAPYALTLHLDRDTLRALRFMGRHPETGRARTPQAILELMAEALAFQAHQGVAIETILRRTRALRARASYVAPGAARELLIRDLIDYLSYSVLRRQVPVLRPDFSHVSKSLMTEVCVRLYDRNFRIPASWLKGFVTPAVQKALERGVRPKLTTPRRPRIMGPAVFTRPDGTRVIVVA